MNFKGDFRLLGRLDIDALRDRVAAFTEAEWRQDEWRQNRPNTAHTQTTSIPLLFDKDFRHSNPTAHAAYRALRPHLDPIEALIRAHYDALPETRALQAAHGDAYPIRMLLTRLPAGGVIAKHFDRNFSLTHSHRIHIPVITAEGVAFRIDGRSNPMRQGEVWEINNRRFHEVANRSAIDRVHLIVDWVIPGERCCCAAHTHPELPCSPVNCFATDRRETPCTCLAAAADEPPTTAR